MPAGGLQNWELGDTRMDGSEFCPDLRRVELSLMIPICNDFHRSIIQTLTHPGAGTMGLLANLDLNSSFSPVGPFEAESVIKTKEYRTRLLIFDRTCEFRNDAALLIAYHAASGMERED